MSEEGDGLVGIVVIVVLVVAVVGHAKGVTVPVPAAPVAQVAAAQPVAQPPPAPSGPGVVYSAAQLHQALAATGMSDGRASIGAAVAEAESGGRSDAVHLCPPRCDPGQSPERSFGPWQLNLVVHSWVSEACAMALDCAARAAAAISGGGANWSPWSTYTNGAWRRYATG